MPVEARISAPIQTDQEAHSNSCTMTNGCLSRGLSGIDHPPPSSAEVKETVELYLYSLSGPPWSGLRRTLHLLAVYISESVNIKNIPNCSCIFCYLCGCQAESHSFREA
jgi:hypothetical protein